MFWVGRYNLRKYSNQQLKINGLSLSVDLIFFIFIFFKIHLFIFRQMEMEGEREGEKLQCVVASHALPTGDLAHNSGRYLTGN